MTSALRFSHASLALGGRTVLRDLHFAVPRGVFVGVLGPNGAGKTTLLRAAMGLVGVAGGSIEVDGVRITRGAVPAGYMPQAAGGLADLRLSGRAFVSVACGGSGWGPPRLSRLQRDDVERVLHLADAAGYAHRAVCTLSGGERQRLLLAQALLGRPRLLLLDEPLAGLDPQHQAATVALVGGLVRRFGISVLFSAHELTPLLPALDLVLYLGGGRAALGLADEVVTAPVLSDLYGFPVEVFRTGGHVFVVGSGAGRDAHARL